MKKNSRIQSLFNHKKAFIAYLTAGDGGISRTLDAALALIKGGVNLLEIGMPFSDPVADGPIIQRAVLRSLAAGTTINDVLWLIKEIRKHSNIPIILFSYLNPVLAALKSDFLKEAKCAGMDGLLLVDCPLEESSFMHQSCIENELALIHVITPSTSSERIQKMNHYAQGFLYYACRKGTTGLRHALPEDFQQKIQMIKSIINLPIVAGFGISSQEMVKSVLEQTDGVVIGSLFVKALEEGANPSDLSEIARELLK